MAIFLYFISKENLTKMGLKMAKNAPNELKLGPDMYFYEFHQITEDFWKIFKMADFWPKNGHLARFSRRDFEKKNSTENITGPSKILRFG